MGKVAAAEAGVVGAETVWPAGGLAGMPKAVKLVKFRELERARVNNRWAPAAAEDEYVGAGREDSLSEEEAEVPNLEAWNPGLASKDDADCVCFCPGCEKS